jgi:hypothetical protein
VDYSANRRKFRLRPVRRQLIQKRHSQRRCDSSALEPDFGILWNVSIFHRIPAYFLNGVVKDCTARSVTNFHSIGIRRGLVNAGGDLAGFGLWGAKSSSVGFSVNNRGAGRLLRLRSSPRRKANASASRYGWSKSPRPIRARRRRAASVHAGSAAAPAEVGEHAVAHISGDETPMFDDNRSTMSMIEADDLPQILRVELCRKWCRTDQVAEHDS